MRKKRKPFEIKIENDIMPPPDVKQGRMQKYPFAYMKINQSFVVPLKERYHVSNSIYAFVKRNPEYRFITRKDGEFCRVWRVELKNK